MEERALFKTWLLFLFLGVSFHMVFYFHDRSTILNISYWGGILVLLIIFQSFINNPIKNNRYLLIIYPVLTVISFYLLEKSLSPYIHFSLTDFFYYFENDSFYKKIISMVNKFMGLNDALLFFSFTNIIFYGTFLFFMLYYIIATPITTLRRVFNGLFSLIGILLLIHFLLPTAHNINHKEYSDVIISSSNFLISYFNIPNMGLASFESSISLYIGLTLFRTNKILGVFYIVFSLLVIFSTIYLKTAYITDIIIGIFLTLMIFFRVDKGFHQNRTSLNI